MSIMIQNYAGPMQGTNLQYNYRKLALKSIARNFTVVKPDLTNIGMKRNGAAKEAHIPAIDAATIDCKLLTGHEIFAGTNMDGFDIHMKLDTSRLLGHKTDASVLASLKQSMMPVTTDVHAAVVATPAYIELVRKSMVQASLAAVRLAGGLTRACMTDLELRKWVTSSGHFPRSGRGDNVNINPEDIVRLKIDAWFSLKGMCERYWDKMENDIAYCEWMILQNNDAFENTESLIRSSPLLPAYDVMVAENAAKLVRFSNEQRALWDSKPDMPHVELKFVIIGIKKTGGLKIESRVTPVVDTFTRLSDEEFNRLSKNQKKEYRKQEAEHDSRGEPFGHGVLPAMPLEELFPKSKAAEFTNAHIAFEAVTVEAQIDDLERLPYLKGLALFALFSHQSNQARAVENYDFAFMRYLTVLHGLYVDSDEVSPFVDLALPEITPELVAEYDKRFLAPEKYYVLMYATVCSFLKSGHHATAFNLENTVRKMLVATQLYDQTDDIPGLIRSCVYHGVHPACVRLLVAMAWDSGAKGELSGAIQYRLHPNPPMAAAYCNLAVFIGAMEKINFFEYLGKQGELAKFKSQMKIIRDTMHFVAPYADYLYGRTADDPQLAKTIVAELGAYAVAINEVIPTSTLALSPALAKLAAQSSNGSIQAHLQVQGFVAAYRKFNQKMVESSMVSHALSKGTKLIAGD